MPKKLPKGISNYEKLIQDNYYYVDKTKYIEKLEEMADSNIMILRPRKFGKSLFVNTLNSYYDINKKNKFEELFKDTYIGNNPTNNKNSYYMLNFDFSGISTNNTEDTIEGFKVKVKAGISRFVNDYSLDFYINEQQTAEGMLTDILVAFKAQKPQGKIYVIIDEYDHFANELLGFHITEFKDLVSKNGKIRKWYEILKEGTKTVVDRIFITGVAPITLDSMTSGFNIVKDFTRDERFNEIFGFTEEELIEIMKEQNISDEKIDELLPIMRENYDGYRFSANGKERMYNSNMCLNFLDDYVGLGTMPNSMVDINIASDYKKLGNMLNLCVGEEREKIIENTVAGEPVISEITEKFNPEKEFDTTDLISMLYYLGYLTISGEKFGLNELKIPNKVMKELYSDYFIEVLNKDTDFRVDSSIYVKMLEELLTLGRVDELVRVAGEYLTRLSNRDYVKFDEKYIKLIFFCLGMNLKSAYFVKSEMEVQRKYPDLLLIPKEIDKEYYSIMIEFKYLKKEEEGNLKEKQEEAEKQIREYKEFEEIKKLNNIKSYTIVAVNDKLYVEEII